MPRATPTAATPTGSCRQTAPTPRADLEEYGLDATRVVEVTGLAATQLRYEKEPLNPSNRRISILLPFLTPPDTPSVDQLKDRLQGSIKQSS